MQTRDLNRGPGVSSPSFIIYYEISCQHLSSTLMLITKMLPVLIGLYTGRHHDEKLKLHSLLYTLFTMQWETLRWHSCGGKNPTSQSHLWSLFLPYQPRRIPCTVSGNSFQKSIQRLNREAANFLCSKMHAYYSTVKDQEHNWPPLQL